MTASDAVMARSTNALTELQRAIETCSFYQLDVLKIKIIDRCNLRCHKCNHWKPNRRFLPDRLTPLTADEWFGVASQAVALGVREVRFSGGEPTLHPLLPDLVCFFTNYGVRCKITTNGTVLAKVKGLAEKLVTAGVTQFTFSVDGPNAELHDHLVGVTGAFDSLTAGLTTLQTISQAYSDHVRWTVHTVVVRQNLEQLVDVLTWSIDHDAHQLTLLKLHQSHLADHTRSRLSLTADDISRYEEGILPKMIAIGKAHNVDVIPVGYLVMPDNTIKPIPTSVLETAPCFSAWNRATLFPSGDVYVCCDVRTDLLHFGNIRELSLEEMLNGPRGRQVRAVCYIPTKYVPECQECDIGLTTRFRLVRQVPLVPEST